MGLYYYRSIQIHRIRCHGLLYFRLNKYNIMKKFGLIGRNISYSFSRGYFAEKFQKLGLTDCTYVNFDFQDISELTEVLKEKEQGLKGMNVTIPYKQEVQPFLTSIDKDAKA